MCKQGYECLSVVFAPIVTRIEDSGKGCFCSRLSLLASSCSFISSDEHLHADSRLHIETDFDEQLSQSLRL